MARPREFDVHEAMDAAMSAFWERGYEATSMDDLLNAMGLTKGSLYKAFGDKHNLFLLSLRDYLDRLFEKMKQSVDANSDPVQSLTLLMGLVEGLCCKQTSPRGCFAVNTVVELSQRDEKASEILKRHLVRVEKLLAKLIMSGQKSGDFRADISAEHLAEALFVYIFGMLAQSRGIANQARTKRLSTFALAMLRSE
ncbi:TetR/AcrR family transcriptional regulator [bacterium]|nr:TetR/AcrR family transcriptional regulator [bacterium]MBP9807054.1 TetR/AcrR family transcriptional regulator [bacterium]